MINSFPIGRGAQVEAFGRRFVVKHEIDANTVEAEDCKTGESVRLNVYPDIALPQNMPPIVEVDREKKKDEKRWAKGQHRSKYVKLLAEMPHRTRKDVERVAKEAGAHPSTMYDWLKVYMARRNAAALMPKKPNGGKDKSRLPDDREDIVQTAIKSHYLTKARKTIEATYQEVRRLALAANIQPPAYSTVRRRIRSMPEKDRLKARGYRKEITERFTPKPDTFEGGTDPLAFVQGDHTRLDIVIVNEEHRQPIGYPYLTAFIDVCTRSVLGYYLSLDPVGRLTTSLALAHAILPKEKWLSQLGPGYEWPMRGRPKIIGVDNAREFDCPWLQVAGEDFGMEIDYRPVRTARYGAFIERFFGTLKGAMKELPGAAGATPQERDGLDPEKTASLTLRELDLWIARWIVGIYHKKYHSGIMTTPLQAWHDGILGTATRRGIGLPDLEPDEERVRISLLPSAYVKLQPFGIRNNYIRYYSPVLKEHIGRRDAPGRKAKYLIRFDPRDLGTIYFFDPDLGQYVLIPYRTPHPAISMWEFNICRARLIAEGQKLVDEHAIFAAKARNDKAAAEAVALTRAQRRARERKRTTERLMEDRPKRAPLHLVVNDAARTSGAVIQAREAEEWL